MQFCRMTGNFRTLYAEFKTAPTFQGPADTIEFIAHGEEALPGGKESFIDIFCETYPKHESSLRLPGLSLPEEERFKSIEAMRNGVWLSAYKEDGVLSYGLSVKLEVAKFEFFSRYSERHLGSGVRYGLSFKYPRFADGKEGRPPTRADFLAGKAHVVCIEPDIGITIWGDAGYREDVPTGRELRAAKR
jgi:hypothetical protein